MVIILPGFAVSEPRSKAVHPEYLKAVKAYADAIIEHGRDSYGRVRSPVFLAGCIDLKSEKFVRRKLEGQGIREGDRAYGANPHHDLNLYQSLYALSRLTGDKKYEQEADKSLKWFFENCQSPNTGLFAWGEHLYWDVTAEECRGRDLHEFYRPWVLWERSFKLAPKACETFAKGLWDHQVHNHSGDFNRHAKWSEHGPGQHCNISRHAGFYIATWAQAYHHTKNPLFLKAIECVLLFKEASRHPVTGALPSDRAPLSVEQWLHYISGQEIKLEHDPRIGGLHSHVSGTLSLAIDLYEEAQVAMICYERWKQLRPGEIRDGYKRLIVACARRYLKSEPAEDAIQKPGVIGDVIFLMAAAYDLSGDRQFLDRADRFADIGVRRFLDLSPLPRAAVGFEHYEAITRGDTMMMALLKLWQIQNHPEINLRLIYTDR